MARRKSGHAKGSREQRQQQQQRQRQRGEMTALPVGQRQQTRTRRTLAHDAGPVGAGGRSFPFAPLLFLICSLPLGSFKHPSMLHTRVSLRTWSLTQPAEKKIMTAQLPPRAQTTQPQDREGGSAASRDTPRREHSPEAQKGEGLPAGWSTTKMPFTFAASWSDRGREGGKDKKGSGSASYSTHDTTTQRQANRERRNRP